MVSPNSRFGLRREVVNKFFRGKLQLQGQAFYFERDELKPELRRRKNKKMRGEVASFPWTAEPQHQDDLLSPALSSIGGEGEDSVGSWSQCDPFKVWRL
jgi:hypothetical protein